MRLPFETSIKTTDQMPCRMYVASPRYLRDRDTLERPDRYTDDSMLEEQDPSINELYENMPQPDFPDIVSFSSDDSEYGSLTNEVVRHLRKLTEEFKKERKDNFKSHFEFKVGSRIKITSSSNKKDVFADHKGIIISSAKKMIQIKLDDGSVIRRMKHKCIVIP